MKTKFISEIAHCLYYGLSREPNNPILSFLQPQGLIEWTCKETILYAEQVAEALLRFGAQSNDVCIIPQTLALDVVPQFLGCLLAGSIPLLLNQSHNKTIESSTTQIRNLAHYQGLSVILISEPMAGTLVRICPPKRQSKMTNLSTLRILQSTSGTTGQPNYCMWSEQGIMASLKNMATAIKLTTCDISVCWTPLCHTVGLMNNLLLMLTHGVQLVLVEPDTFIRNPERWPQLLSEMHATLTWAPNFAYTLLTQSVTDELLVGVDLSMLRLIINAGERIDSEQYFEFYRRFAPYGLKLSALNTNYGCAEHTGGISFSQDGPCDWVSEPIFRTADCKNYNPTHVVSVGRPTPNTKVVITDKDGKPVADGILGEITIQSPSVFMGYLGNIEATDEVLKSGYLHTGDLGYQYQEKLFWVGRSKEVINIRGRKYDPNAFAPLLAKEGIMSYAAFGIDDSVDGTEKVYLLAELPKEGIVDKKILVQQCRRNILSNFGIALADVVLLPPNTLKNTASGKRRHRYYSEVYLRGEFNCLKLD